MVVNGEPVVEGSSTSLFLRWERTHVAELEDKLEARAVDGSTLRVPDELHDITAVLIFYRGHW